LNLCWMECLWLHNKPKAELHLEEEIWTSQVNCVSPERTMNDTGCGLLSPCRQVLQQYHKLDQHNFSTWYVFIK
jgi:hypothetical protein